MGEDRFRSNPFEKLRGLKVPLQNPPEKAEPEKSDEDEPESNVQQFPEAAPGTGKDRVKTELELTADGLLPEDQAVFDEIKRLAGLSKKGRDENRYWRVRDAIRDSRERDVDYELDRWLGNLLRGTVGSPLEEALKPVRRRGWISSARKWLESATADGMKYGRKDFTREMRIAEAKKLALKAGLTLQEIADTHKLKLDFNIVEE